MNDLVVTVDGMKKNVIINDGTVVIDGKEYRYEIIEKHPWAFALRLNQKVYTVTRVLADGESQHILIEGHYFESFVRSRLEEEARKISEASAKDNGRTSIKSPMPGLVVKLKKAEGEKVHAGESVIILEAMKMENDVKSTVSGTISKVLVSEKQAVEKNTVLFIVE